MGAYILMPDHFHVFVVIDDREPPLSAWIKSLKGTLSSKMRKHAKLPPFWQKGFFDHVLRSGDSYSAKWIYVRENAVRAGLVSNWEQWPYLGEVFDLEFRSHRE
jgi:REP element-mobilizing transposase RayT